MVRAVLIRHLADLSKLNHSASERSVSLYGALKKDPMGDFRPNEIECMLKDIQRLPGVRSLEIRLENWNITPQGTGWNIKAVQRRAQKPEQEDNLTIDSHESIANVLRELFLEDGSEQKP
jgi:hypothetical protein